LCKRRRKERALEKQKTFFHFRTGRLLLDVRIEESWSQLGRIDGWWNGQNHSIHG
jgi:hypothetical protein